MYLAQLTTLQTQAPFYISILEKIIKGEANQENRANIDSAIFEAIHVAKGDKNVFSIDNDHYFFITKLLSEYKQGLIAVDEGDLQVKTYSDILSILK